MAEDTFELWPYAAFIADVTISIVASSHAVLHKRDVRSAIVWVGLIWLAPLLGTLLYVWLGINRIQRRARKLRAEPHRPDNMSEDHHADCVIGERLAGQEHFKGLVRLIDATTHRPLLHGNRVQPLLHGDEAYPAMLEAIDEARASVTLSTYIFDDDRAGAMFLEALERAHRRGVAVRVIIDDFGARYSWPGAPRLLHRAGIRHARFLPPIAPWRLPYMNLRTHRKLLVVDGRVGFTGGMNIREGHFLALDPKHPVRDLHFRVTGPVVNHLQEVFAEDWAFCSGELLEGAPWFAPLTPDGPVLARGLADGPDDDFETFHLTLLGALAAARESVIVCTPYFIPDAALITALNVAAMRGVSVDIVLPERGNLPLVQWASTAQLWQVLDRGCRVWLTPPPFEHTKLFLVDGIAAFVGSANWDPRSLRLNFEFNLECYDEGLAAELTEYARERIAASRSLSLAEVNARSLPIRLRDGVARLFAPFL